MDELSIYRNKKETFMLGKFEIHNPTLDEISDESKLGEKQFWVIVSDIISTPYDRRLYLWSKGIDFNSVDSFDLFCDIVENHLLTDVSFIIRNIDFGKMKRLSLIHISEPTRP